MEREIRAEQREKKANIRKAQKLVLKRNGSSSYSKGIKGESGRHNGYKIIRHRLLCMWEAYEAGDEGRLPHETKRHSFNTHKTNC